MEFILFIDDELLRRACYDFVLAFRRWLDFQGIEYTSAHMSVDEDENAFRFQVRLPNRHRDLMDQMIRWQMDLPSNQEADSTTIGYPVVSSTSGEVSSSRNDISLPEFMPRLRTISHFVTNTRRRTERPYPVGNVIENVGDGASASGSMDPSTSSASLAGPSGDPMPSRWRPVGEAIASDSFSRSRSRSPLMNEENDDDDDDEEGVNAYLPVNPSRLRNRHARTNLVRRHRVTRREEEARSPSTSPRGPSYSPLSSSYSAHSPSYSPPRDK